MSVMLITDLKAYRRLLSGLQMFRLCESEFIQRFTEFSEERAKNLYQLYLLNIKTWNNRYKDNETKALYTEDEFIKAINIRVADDNYNEVEQVYKSLQFLKYQIEDNDLKLTYEEQNAIKWLKSYINDVNDYLIKKFTKYDQMKWTM